MPTNDRPIHYPVGSSPIWTILGGDARQMTVARRLAEAGFTVRTFALGDVLPTGVTACDHIEDALDGAFGVVLPTPVTRDGESVSTPMAPESALSLENIEKWTQTSTTAHFLCGGALPAHLHIKAAQNNITVIDFLSREDIQIYNAHITAEGALMVAMELLDTTLAGSTATVLGYGRIGRALARMLNALGAHVTVYARRDEVLALASTEGCRTVRLTEKPPLLPPSVVIFNTIPARLLDREALTDMNQHTVVVDLAPAPGVADPQTAREVAEHGGVRVVPAPSLPGRYAPVSAGHILADCILKVLGEVVT